MDAWSSLEKQGAGGGSGAGNAASGRKEGKDLLDGFVGARGMEAKAALPNEGEGGGDEGDWRVVLTLSPSEIPPWRRRPRSCPADPARHPSPWTRRWTWSSRAPARTTARACWRSCFRGTTGSRDRTRPWRCWRTTRGPRAEARVEALLAGEVTPETADGGPTTGVRSSPGSTSPRRQVRPGHRGVSPSRLRAPDPRGGARPPGTKGAFGRRADPPGHAAGGGGGAPAPPGGRGGPNRRGREVVEQGRRNARDGGTGGADAAGEGSRTGGVQGARPILLVSERAVVHRHGARVGEAEDPVPLLLLDHLLQQRVIQVLVSRGAPSAPSAATPSMIAPAPAAPPISRYSDLPSARSPAASSALSSPRAPERTLLSSRSPRTRNCTPPSLTAGWRRCRRAASSKTSGDRVRKMRRRNRSAPRRRRSSPRPRPRPRVRGAPPSLLLLLLLLPSPSSPRRRPARPGRTNRDAEGEGRKSEVAREWSSPASVRRRACRAVAERAARDSRENLTGVLRSGSRGGGATSRRIRRGRAAEEAPEAAAEEEEASSSSSGSSNAAVARSIVVVVTARSGEDRPPLLLRAAAVAPRVTPPSPHRVVSPSPAPPAPPPAPGTRGGGKGVEDTPPPPPPPPAPKRLDPRSRRGGGEDETDAPAPAAGSAGGGGGGISPSPTLSKSKAQKVVRSDTISTRLDLENFAIALCTPHSIAAGFVLVGRRSVDRRFAPSLFPRTRGGKRATAHRRRSLSPATAATTTNDRRHRQE
ncbi:hypothetical protein ACHAWF_018364 [Thalassiosira exigua]